MQTKRPSDGEMILGVAAEIGEAAEAGRRKPTPGSFARLSSPSGDTLRPPRASERRIEFLQSAQISLEMDRVVDLQWRVST